MTKKAIILGCSHAAGAEMYPRTVPDHVEKGYKESYPMLIAEEFGFSPINHAIYGGSNDAMFRIFTETMAELDSTDLVIACWSGATRTEIFHDGHQLWMQISPNMDHIRKRQVSDLIPQGRIIGEYIDHHDDYMSYVKQWIRMAIDQNRYLCKNNQLKNILALNYLARKNDITTWNFFSFNPVRINDFIWPLEEENNFMNWCTNSGFPTVGLGHFPKEAHRAYADFAIQAVRSQGLCS